MSTPATKAKATRAKNLKIKLANEEKLRRANSAKRTAQNKLKFYKEGFEDGLKVRRD